MRCKPPIHRDPLPCRFRRLVANGMPYYVENVDYQMSEDLKQAGGNEGLEVPAEGIVEHLLKP